MCLTLYFCLDPFAVLEKVLFCRFEEAEKNFVLSCRLFRGNLGSITFELCFHFHCIECCLLWQLPHREVQLFHVGNGLTISSVTETLFFCIRELQSGGPSRSEEPRIREDRYALINNVFNTAAIVTVQTCLYVSFFCLEMQGGCGNFY